MLFIRIARLGALSVLVGAFLLPSQAGAQNTSRANDPSPFITISPSRAVTTHAVSQTPLAAQFRFQPIATYNAGGDRGNAIAVGDVNRDGNFDVVVATGVDGCCDGTIAVLLGNGDGTFQPEVSYDSGGVGSTSVVVADVNGDGNLDVLVSNWSGLANGDGSLGVLLGNGNGTFQPVVVYDSGNVYSQSLTLADLNGDGKADVLIVGSRCNDGTANCEQGVVGVLLGNGDGTFRASNISYTGANVSTSVATADLNGDGKVDVLVGNYDGNLSVLLGKGDGTFKPPVVYPVGSLTVSVVSGDLNADGKADVVIVDACAVQNGCRRSTVGVLLGNGDGTLQPMVPYSAGGGFNVPDSIGGAGPVMIADVNLDGKSDLLVGQVCFSDKCSVGGVGVLLGNGDGTFQPPASYPSGGFSANGLAVADVNADGGPDVLVVDCGFVFCGGESAVLGVLLAYSPTYTSVVSSLNPAVYGQAITWTSTVTSKGAIQPVGKVRFTWGNSNDPGVLSADGTASLTRYVLNAGAYPVSATYEGDSTHAISTSAALTQVIRQAATSASLVSKLNPSLFGQAVTFVFTVTSPTVRPSGPVTFAAAGAVLGTVQLKGGVAKFTTSTLAVGSTRIKATYVGDSNIAGASVSLVQDVQ